MYTFKKCFKKAPLIEKSLYNLSSFWGGVEGKKQDVTDALVTLTYGKSGTYLS